LERLFISMQKHMPGFPCIVSDDSQNAKDNERDTIVELCKQYKCSLVQLPFDSGVSRGRNALAAHVQTEMMLMMDEDFVVEQAQDTAEASGWLNVDRMVARMDSYGFAVLGGKVIVPSPKEGEDPWRIDEYVGLAKLAEPMGTPENTLRWCTNPDLMTPFVFLDEHTGEVIMCRLTDRLVNFFIARVDLLLANPWRDDLMVRGLSCLWNFTAVNIICK
jgi:glycosyl transferase family 2